MSESVHILVVGVGSIGERHVRCFQQSGRAAVSICEPNAPRRQQVVDRYPVVRAYASLNDALQADPTYDAAVIAVPANCHIEVGQQLAEQGIHLLIEKPLSTTLEGVQKLGNTITQNDLVAAVAYVHRHHPALAAMRDAIVKGRIGQPIQLVATSGQHFPTYRPAYREIYYTDHRTGGGAIQDALTHILNAGQWLVGPVASLVADSAHQLLPGVSVEDAVHVITRHDRVMGCYSLNQFQAPNELTITVVGEAGTARYESHNNRWRWMTEPGGTWQDQPAGPLERDQLFINQANSFIDAIQRKSEPACSLSEATETLHAILAILNSCQTHSWQTPATGLR